MTESEMQRSVFAEIDLLANQDARWHFCFHVPNGGDRDVRVAAMLKAQGVRRGVPDILWLMPAYDYCGLAMELKVGKNRMTPEQNDWLNWFYSNNYFACIVYDNPEAAIAILKRYLNGARK